ncbi:S1C family serine protease [Spirillospora sp. NPDC048911]|uniref:S1C family serine protease n=1 Tax=Spirillospora sp. NPDC048911 TaxID=3364527 RepID=UPI003723388F
MHEAPNGRGAGTTAGCAVVAVLVVAAAAALVSVLLGRPLPGGADQQGGTVAASETPLAKPRSKKPSGKRPGVVNIFTEQGLRGVGSAGTGIIIDPSGLVLTNNHVIQGATTIRGTNTDTRRTYRAKVLGYQKSGDIALIQLVGAADLIPAVLDDSGDTRKGDVVTAVGNAGGKGGDPEVVTGTITALDRDITATDQSDGSSEKLSGLIETNAPIKPGDSGGPLLNTKGQVIGMNTAASANYSMKQEGGPSPRGYSIPSRQALTIVRQIQRGDSSNGVHIGRTALLGVQVRTPTTQSGGEGNGAFITGLLRGTPAEQAGLRRRTTIVALDDQQVDSPGTLTDLLLQHQPGDTVQVIWTDAAGNRFRTAVTLGDGPPQ